MKDYYKILQVDPEASLEVLNNAYRALVRQYHPDLYHSQRKDRFNGKMQDINEAYKVLSNEVSRREYDVRYRSWKTQQSQKQVLSELPGSIGRLRNLLFWAIGSFLVFRFVLKPFIALPIAKVLILVAFGYILFRLYGNRKSQT